MGSFMVVSDSHLSERAPEAGANWAAVADYVAASPPDLVVHLGDLTLDAPSVPAELAAARALLDELAVPWAAVPGNHDIGDNPWPELPASYAVDGERLNRWRATIGPDWWARELDGWFLVAVDAQLFGSDLPAEAHQWSWLADTVAGIDPAAPIMLLSHKPVAADETELAAAPPYRFVPPDARRRLDELLADHHVPVVLSGHVHQYRVLDVESRRHVWAPTSWAVLPEEVQPLFGDKRVGVLRVEVDPGGEVRTTLVEPAGLRQLTLTEDIADPYHP